MFASVRRQIVVAVLIATLSAPAFAQFVQGQDTDPTTSATLGPGEITAGEIADRIGAAWANVTSYRAVSRVFPTGDAGTPVPGAIGQTERFVILPDQKRVVIYDGNGTIELVFVASKLQKRQTPFGGEAGAWEVIDPGSIADDDPFAIAYASILAPEQPPYSTLSDRQRDRIGTAQEPTEINGQTCTGYQFPEVTLTGEQIRVTIYLGPDDLPCRIETIAGLTTSQTDYVFNQETSIATPAP
jgi:hypothetical protein